MKRVLIIFLASRMWMLGLLFWNKWVWGANLPHPNQTVYLENPILNFLNLYDSINYVEIVLQGYQEERLTVFFPLMPSLVKILVWLGMDVYFAGFLLSHLFFFLSLWMLDQLLEKRGWTLQHRKYVLWLLALFPSSYFFSAFYTESLFLFLTLCSFYCWDNERRGWAYVIGGLAALTRIVGVFIPFAFFIERCIKRKATIKDVMYAALSAFLFALYPIYLWIIKGNPFLFITAQEYYPRRSGYPFESIWVDIRLIIENQSIHPLVLIHFGLLILFGIYLYYSIFEIRQTGKWAEWIFSAAAVTLPLSSVAMVVSPVATHGFIRYLLPIFPFFIYWGVQWSKWVMTYSYSWSAKTGIWVGRVVWTLVTIYCYVHFSYKGFIA